MTPEELIGKMAAYQSGDASAFDAIFKELSPRVYGYLVHSTGDRVTADDLLQEVFLSIHRARATWRPGSPVAPWVFAIARHAAVSRARSAGRRSRREEAREDISDLAGPESAPEHDDPRIDEIRAALAELPAPQREAVMMLKVSGLSLAEAAAATGSTVGAMKLRAHRAYETIRKRLLKRSAKKEDAA